MRRRLALVSLAVTTMVITAFVVPLVALVRSQAEARAVAAAQRSAESVATALAVAGGAAGDSTVETAAAVVEAFGDDRVSVVFPDDWVVGASFVPGNTIDRARRGASFTAETTGGIEVLVPVVGPTGDSLVVRAFAPDAELRSGVAPATATLLALAVLMLALSAVVADRLARSIVTPVDSLASAAERLGRGALDTRVVPGGPPEIAEVGAAFNELADRLTDLLRAERESVADLSHRLRTPLTSLRLAAEAVSDDENRSVLIAEITRLEGAIDRLIGEARRPVARSAEPRVSDLAAVVRHRVAFWQVLADEQGRRLEVVTPTAPAPVSLASDDVGAVIDTLFENLFAHTPAGTAATVTVATQSGSSVLVFEDEGPGLADGSVVDRGVSGSGSTGLGLDIVRRAAERSGGTMEVANGPRGGAMVTVAFGPGSPPPS